MFLVIVSLISPDTDTSNTLLKNIDERHRYSGQDPPTLFFQTMKSFIVSFSYLSH